MERLQTSVTSLDINEKFTIEGEPDVYYFITQTPFYYVLWNHTRKKRRMLDMSMTRNQLMRVVRKPKTKKNDE